MRARILLAAAAATAASAASADVAISTFTFSDLDSEYFTADGVTGFYTARAGGDTSGDVTRLNVPTVETANYEPAFALDDSSMADVVFEMSISNITANSADGAGSFMLTDYDGDTISGELSGSWSQATAGAPVLFFNGTLSNVVFSATGDGFYEGGQDGGGFELTDFLVNNVFEGGIVQVSFGLDTFFDESFNGFNSQFSGTIVPTPGAFALVGLGGIAALRRRR